MTIKKALTFAKTAHGSQKRKYTGAPYYVHLVEVMKLVKSVTKDEEMLQAALLHDVVEDTPVTLQQVRDEFGDRVAMLVGGLTDVSRPEDGNRKKRKAIDRAKLQKQPADVQTIKYADIISNARDISENDPKFAVVYLDEMRQLLAGMKKGNQKLYKLALQLVR